MRSYENILFPKNRLSIAVEQVEKRYGSLKYAPDSALQKVHQIVKSAGMLGNQYYSRRK